MVHRHFGKISRLESVGISKMRRRHLHVRRQSSPTHNPASNTQTPNLGKGLANTFPKEAPNEQIHSIRECTHPVCAQPQARSASWERTGKVRFVRNIRSVFKNYNEQQRTTHICVVQSGTASLTSAGSSGKGHISLLLLLLLAVGMRIKDLMPARCRPQRSNLSTSRRPSSRMRITDQRLRHNTSNQCKDALSLCSVLCTSLHRMWLPRARTAHAATSQAL